MSEDKNKDKLLLKKAQAKLKVYQKENRFLKYKLRDTQRSRAYWKSLAKGQSGAKQLEQAGGLFAGTKAKHHSYSLLLVAFCTNMEAYGAMSLRACVQVLFCLQLSFGHLGRIPSYSSIRIWVCKLGKNRIENEGFSAEKWLYWVDESIHIGNDKILLVLGMAEKDLTFSSGLGLGQVRVLHMEVSKEWKGEQIAEILRALQAKYPLAYVVSDAGNNLKKSYTTLDCLHIPDCTHTLSKGLEKCYKGTLIFEEFCRWAGDLRKKWSLNQAKKAYLPPNQRNKVRFANLFPLVEWAKKQLDNWEHLPKDVQIAFDFLHKHPAWVLHFWQIQTQLVAISLILKIEGYSAVNDTKIRAILASHLTEQREHKIFSEVVLAYLSSLAQKIGDRPRLYCCSDVIESAFGKLKQKLGKNRSALTAFIFTLAAIGGQYQEAEVQNALENIREKDLILKSKIPKKKLNEN